MMKTRTRWIPAILALALILSAAPTFVDAAATATDAQQHRAIVADTLSAQGLTAQEVEARLDLLTDEDLAFFAAHPDQIQSAGREIPNHVLWITVGAVGLLVLIAIF